MEPRHWSMNSCHLITLLYISAFIGTLTAHVFLSRTEANHVLLHRSRRANSFLEELKLGNLERECLEEQCSYEEAREIFAVPEQLDRFWKSYTEEDHCKSNPCENGATCISQEKTYICLCPPEFQGPNCDKEEQKSVSCLYNNGGCEHFCTETEEPFLYCHCASDYRLAADNKSCEAQVPVPCGRTNEKTLTPKIVRGQECHKGQCPWQALLKYKDRYDCGGVVLNNQWIVTAAHCVWRKTMSKLQVIVGDYKRDENDRTEQSRRISKIIIHPQYNHTNTDADLALLQLGRNISLGPYVVPICLPPTGGTFTRTLGAVRSSTVSGWGRLTQNGPPANILQRLEVPRVPLDVCREHTGLNLTNNMLCAGFQEGGRDACHGDSGGPLATRYKNTWFLTGIVSFGKGCAKSNSYGIYTRISVFVEWIINTMTTK